MVLCENRVGRSTAREEGKRETKRNATKMATGDKHRGHGLFTSQGASTRADKMESMANMNLPIRVEYNSKQVHINDCHSNLFTTL